LPNVNSPLPTAHGSRGAPRLEDDGVRDKGAHVLLVRHAGGRIWVVFFVFVALVIRAYIATTEPEPIYR
jgi:hypothetical protein